MTRFLLVTATVVLAVVTSTAAEPTAEERIAQMTDLLTKVTKLLSIVKDEKTATDAKAKLNELGAKYVELKKAIQKLPPEALGKDPEKTLAALAKAEGDLTLAHDRVFSKAKPAYKVLHGGKLFDAIEQPLEEKAAATAMILRRATNSYAAMNGGAHPKQLVEVAAPTVKGFRPLVNGKEKAVIDPWGFPYQYELEKKTVGKTQIDSPVVWTVSPYSGKKLGSP